MPRPALEILAAISLVVIAAALFLRRTFADGLANLPTAEVILYTAMFGVAAGYVSSRLTRSPIPTRVTLLLGLLVSLAFAAGLSADPFDAFGGLFAIVLTLAIARLDKLHVPQHRLTPSEETGRNQVQGETPPPDDSDVSQSITRRAVGSDCHVEGMLNFEIPSGETVHQLHIPFWPVLPGIPEVECEIDGLEARLRVPLAAAHGLRIEVRAAQASNTTRHGTLHFAAFASSASAAA